MWLSHYNTNISVPLLHMMSQVDTLTKHHTTMHVPSTTTNEYYSATQYLHDVAWSCTGYKISALVAHWHSDSYTTCSVSYESIPQHWCRSNKNATGEGGDYNCFCNRRMH